MNTFNIRWLYSIKNYDTFPLFPGDADDSYPSRCALNIETDSANGAAIKDKSDIVIARANYRIELLLILFQQFVAVIGCITICRRIRRNDCRFAINQNQANRQLALVDGIN